MKKKPLMGLTAIAALITLVILGCSSVTPDPEVKIVTVNPIMWGGDTLSYTVVFKNLNKVDAIITSQQETFRGQTDTVIVPKRYYSFYIPGNTDSASLKVTWVGMNAYRTLTGGSPMTLFIRFDGTDAYGYNKAFFDTFRISL
jgi:hypothetical protein